MYKKEYLVELDKFKKKHSFSDDDCSRFREEDIRYDILLDLPEDALGQWEEYCSKNGYISLVGWTGIDNGYTPKVNERSGMEDFKTELGFLKNELERSFDLVFGKFYEEDDSDSDLDIEE